MLHPKAREHQELQANTGDSKRGGKNYPQELSERMALLTTYLWAFSLQSCETIHFVILSHLFFGTLSRKLIRQCRKGVNFMVDSLDEEN